MSGRVPALRHLPKDLNSMVIMGYSQGTMLGLYGPGRVQVDGATKYPPEKPMARI
jgi:hypothetical protein